MEQPQQRELEIHLVEYKRLSDELTRDTQSIDRYLALYLTAFFAVLAFMIQSGTGTDGVNYIEAVKQSPDLIFLALLVPIVNSVLVVRIAHLTSQMFARAQHIGVRIRPRVVDLVGTHDILRWDEVPSVQNRTRWWIRGFDSSNDDLPAKRASQWLRIFPAAGFFLLAIGISVTILVLLRTAWSMSLGLAVLYTTSWTATALAALSGTLLVHAGTAHPTLDPHPELP
jgi:hypothetical protein